MDRMDRFSRANMPYKQYISYSFKEKVYSVSRERHEQQVMKDIIMYPLWLLKALYETYATK